MAISRSIHVAANDHYFLLFFFFWLSNSGLSWWLSDKESASQYRRHRFDLWEDPLEKRKATHSSILVWRIPWIEEPGRLLSMGSKSIRHD